MDEARIPKVIHYCWFSGEEMPAFLRACVETWGRVMPDYRVKVWDADSFDFGSVPFVKEAFEARKWAFVADYVRLHALYHEGGIYLDSDVRVFRRFDEFLGYDFFTSHEIHPYNFTQAERDKLDAAGRPLDPQAYIYGLNIQAAIMGGAKGCRFLGECLEFYRSQRLLGADGKPLCEQLIIGPLISKIAERYGYRYTPERQILEGNMLILEPEAFVGNSAFLDDGSYAIHLCNGSWKDMSRFEQVQYKIRNAYPFLAPVLSVARKVVDKATSLAKPRPDRT